MVPTRVSPAELDLPYRYVTCPNCGRLNAVPSGYSRFQCLKCGSDVRVDGDLTVVERARSRQSRRLITAAIFGAIGLSLFLYAMVKQFLQDLPVLHSLGVPAWEWWLPIRHVYSYGVVYRGLLPGYLGLILLAMAAATAYRAYRRA